MQIKASLTGPSVVSDTEVSVKAFVPLVKLQFANLQTFTYNEYTYWQIYLCHTDTFSFSSLCSSNRL